MNHQPKGKQLIESCCVRAKGDRRSRATNSLKHPVCGQNLPRNARARGFVFERDFRPAGTLIIFQDDRVILAGIEGNGGVIDGGRMDSPVINGGLTVEEESDTVPGTTIRGDIWLQ
jgi:hypothetical protein